MHAIKITPNLLFEFVCVLLFEYQCTSGKFIRLPNRIETFLPELECSSAHVASKRNFTSTSTYNTEHSSLPATKHTTAKKRTKC